MRVDNIHLGPRVRTGRNQQWFAMRLAPLSRTVAAAVCLLLIRPAWAAAGETAPPVPPERPDGIVVADAVHAAEASDATEATDAPASAGAPDMRLAPAARMEEARALVDAGRFAEALDILGRLVSGNVVEGDALFLYGLAAIGASLHPGVSEESREALLNEAIAALHAMLLEDPDHLLVRLELARAFFFKGEDALARRHFIAVLGTDPPEPVAANIRRFLSRIEGRGRWSYKLGAALAPDSNIGRTSDERTIYIFNLPFEKDVEELTTSGIGVSVWGGAEYQRPLSARVRLRAGAEFARREYERSRFDQLFVATHVGPRWQVDGSTGLSLLASARQRWLGTSPDNRELGGRLKVDRRLSRSVTVSGTASWHRRRYRTRDVLDGPVFGATLRASWIAMPTVRLDFSGGYGCERPGELAWRSRTGWLGAAVSVNLPLRFDVGAGAEVSFTDYHESAGRWFPYISDGSAREDRTRSIRASIRIRGFTLHDFSPELVVMHEDHTSNAQLYDYTRTRGELRFLREF